MQIASDLIKIGILSITGYFTFPVSDITKFLSSVIFKFLNVTGHCKRWMILRLSNGLASCAVRNRLILSSFNACPSSFLIVYIHYQKHFLNEKSFLQESFL